MLTWIMFLKFLDDMKRVREEDVMLEGKRFRPPSSRPTVGARIPAFAGMTAAAVPPHRAALPLARGFPLSRE